MNRPEYQTISAGTQCATMAAQILRNLDYIRETDADYNEAFDGMVRKELDNLLNGTLQTLYRLNNEVKERRAGQ